MAFKTGDLMIMFTFHNHTASFWTVEEVDLSKDLADWARLKVSIVHTICQPHFIGKAFPILIPVEYFFMLKYCYYVALLILLCSPKSSILSNMCWPSLLQAMELSTRTL